MSEWIIVLDFDGTITERDVGNELSAEALGQRFFDTHAAYKRKEFGLKELQQKIWTNFPMGEKHFRERALHYAKLRPGVVEFFDRCLAKKIPVYIASCGIRAYIEAILDGLLPTRTRPAIRDIRCNEARFGANSIAEFIPPASSPDCPYPLDKGAWAMEMKARHPGAKVFAAGNGTSDRSFWPHVDLLAATEGLATWCSENKVPFTPFEDFRDFKDLPIF
ncbi:MAG: haloacid dehalogenase-like hydrolase [Bdellovibrionales bacterium]|nr:haloacid dehalogenase-like hydrolase [Bdellovibrionales bacterium]